MPIDDAFADRGRALEEEYFRKRDKELVERMRRAAAEAETRRELSAKTGLDDPVILQEIQALGFTPETVSLLPLVPLVQVAWAEGGVTAEERRLINELARSRGIADGSAAAQQLAAWLTHRPDPQVFEQATRLIRAMLAAQGQESGSLTVDDLVRYCETIAGASGGVLGLRRISSEERALLATIAEDLKKREG
jgi:hypothetical protein